MFGQTHACTIDLVVLSPTHFDEKKIQLRITKRYSTNVACTHASSLIHIRSLIRLVLVDRLNWLRRLNLVVQPNWTLV